MTCSDSKRKKRTTLNLYVHVAKPPFPRACALRNWTIASPGEGHQSIGCASVPQYGSGSSFIDLDLVIELRIVRLRAYARSFYVKTVDPDKMEEFNDRNGTSFKAGHGYNL